MTPSVRVSRYLEEELQRVEDRLRAMRMEPTSLHSSTSPETDENSGDSHDPEWASLTTEIVDETHSRLLTRTFVRPFAVFRTEVTGGAERAAARSRNDASS